MNRTSGRCMLLSPEYVVMEDRTTRPTPTDTWDVGIGALLTRIGQRLMDEAVLLVDAGAAERLGLPPTAPTSDDDGDLGVIAHPALSEARAAGWEVGALADWMTFTRPGQRIRVGVLPWIKPGDCPLISPTVLDMPSAFAAWHRWSGRAWHGAPSWAGLQVLAHTAPRGRLTPTWKPTQGYPGIEAQEEPWYPHTWSQRPATPYAHGYDKTRMYVGAANVVELAPWSLKPTGRRDFDPSAAGWWLVELPAWQSPFPLPDPAGYGGRRASSWRWLTTPTVTLLAQLAEEGLYGQFYIHDSWTANRTKRVLKSWTERMARVYDNASDNPTGRLDYAMVREAAKVVGHKTLGALNSPDNWAYRPDWWFSIVAQARCDLWRAMLDIGRTEKRWPWYVDTDCVWYGSEHADPEQARPAGIRLLNQKGKPDTLGTFKIKGTKVLENAA